MRTIEFEPITYDFGYGEKVEYDTLYVLEYFDGNLAIAIDGGYEREVVSVNLSEDLPENVFRADMNSNFAAYMIKELDKQGVVEKHDLPDKQSGFVTYPAYRLIK